MISPHLIQAKSRWQQLFLPRTLYQWTLIGAMIITLPLAAAVVSGVLFVTNYSEKSQQALLQTVRATQGSRTLLERLISMERSIRQYQVLNAPELFDVFKDHHRAFLNTAATLDVEGLSVESKLEFKKLIADERALFQKIIVETAVDRLNGKKIDLDEYVALTLRARALWEGGVREVGVEAERQSAEAEAVRKKMLFWALLMLPLALFMAVIFVSLITQPIKRLEQAIERLGAGDLNRAINIPGPRDLANLGRHLDWLRCRMNELEGDKQRFLRNVSHELKTPLATLKEGAGLLEDEVVGELNLEQRDIVQLIKQASLQLNALINNLLDYQRALSSNTKLDCALFDLSVLVKEVRDGYRLIIQSRNLSVEEHLEPVEIDGDREKIATIVSNLLSNALKYSPVGGSLQITVQRSGAYALILIEDQGVGIADAEQGLVFDEFYQSQAPDSWAVRGSGLGLAVVKEFVQAHAGNARLLEPTKTYSGVRFLVELPLNCANARGAA